MSKKDLLDIHDEALREFNEIQTAMRNERMECLQDRRFCSIAGAQWEGPLGAQFENKPKLEVNKIQLAVMRIINDYRNNLMDVQFVSKDGAEDTAMADTCAGLYRSDEQDSSAEEAKDNAFEEAVTGGFGAWRLRAVYADEESEDDRQRISFEPIFDADSSVFFDLMAKRQDKSDAKRCFVLTAMTPEAYEAEYDDDPASWQKEIGSTYFDWSTPHVVYVAEYYRVEDTSTWCHYFTGITGDEIKVDEDDLDTKGQDLLATGYKETRKKRVKSKEVHKYILSGNAVLEDCGIIAGKNIPIIPVYGKRWYVDNIERCMGHVRLAKDPQRLKNMQVSKLAEVAALSSIEKPIFVPEQMAGHTVMWEQDNIKNYPYLLVNPVTDMNGNQAVMGPIAYTHSATIPPAMGALLQLTEIDMQEVLGNQQQADKIVPNSSGKAIELVQTRLDSQSYIYMSNMSKAIKRCGEIWLSMARELFIEEGRKMKAIGGNGKPKQVELMRPIIDEQTGGVKYENNFEDASFDVAVEVGPSSSSQRTATVRALTSMMGYVQDPETQQVITAMVMMNMEGEGIQSVRDFFRRKLVKMGIEKPTEAEAKALQDEAANQKPDPQTELIKASAIQATAQAQKAQSDATLNEAKTMETHAKTAEILSGIKQQHHQNLMNLADAIQH